MKETNKQYLIFCEHGWTPSFVVKNTNGDSWEDVRDCICILGRKYAEDVDYINIFQKVFNTICSILVNSILVENEEYYWYSAECDMMKVDIYSKYPTTVYLAFTNNDTNKIVEMFKSENPLTLKEWGMLVTAYKTFPDNMDRAYVMEKFFNLQYYKDKIYDELVCMDGECIMKLL
jgi:hypothetical protein